MRPGPDRVDEVIALLLIARGPAGGGGVGPPCGGTGAGGGGGCWRGGPGEGGQGGAGGRHDGRL